MNMPEKQIAVRQHCIETLETQSAYYPGYPTERFVRTTDSQDNLVPDGPWMMNNDSLPSGLETQLLRAKMCQIDEEGRPIHPWFEDLVQNIGVIAGKGKYWNWGPNHTVDPIVITKEETPRILLIERGDNGNWAFPGGFLDYPGESTTDASRRECKEETTYEIPVEPEKTIYQGVVADQRTTAHAWAYTTAKLFRPDQAAPVSGEDDAESAKWFDINSLPSNLHGSHAKIIELALREL